MAAITQTIAIVDKSNKVVSTSKQLKNVFKEAKMAYLERKAEIVAERATKEDRELRKAMRAMTMEEETTDSRASSRSHSRKHHRSRRDNPRDHQERTRPSLQDHRQPSARPVQSGYSNRSSSTPGSPLSHDSSRSHTPLGQFNADLHASRSAPVSPVESRRNPTSLVRRATDLPLTTTQPRPPQRSFSSTDLDDAVDMDLAYGDFHPQHHPRDLALRPDVEQQLQKQELASLVTKCKILLDEANCAQHSVKAIILHLQKNPDAMAAVALTLAEISNIATKMAPAALATFKTSAPAVFAMLASPHFMIAVGVGVGLTVVAFGGYKIVKKIQAKNKEKEGEAGVDEMLDVEELDRIEHWRRGIADVGGDAAETGSVISTATSVEGEFITPLAARSMGHLPRSEGKGRKKSSKKEGKDGKEGKEKKKKHRKTETEIGTETGAVGSEVGSEATTNVSTSSRRSSKTKDKDEKLSVSVQGTSLKDRAIMKVKKPSPLRRMFRSNETNSTAS